MEPTDSIEFELEQIIREYVAEEVEGEGIGEGTEGTQGTEQGDTSERPHKQRRVEAEEWELPGGSDEILAGMGNRERANFRDRWVIHMINTYPHLKELLGGYKGAQKHLRNKFQQQAEPLRQGWYCYQADKTRPCPPLPQEEWLLPEDAVATRQGLIRSSKLSKGQKRVN